MKEQKVKPPVLLDEHEAADYLTLSHKTLQLWRVKGKGPRWKKLGASIRYLKDDLDQFLRES